VIQAVDRAVRILMVLQGARRMSLGEVAAELQLAPSTVHGIIRTLLAHGMVAQERDSGRYRLGPATLRLGNVYLHTLELRSRVVGWAEDLARRTGCAVRAGVLLQGDVVVVHHEPRPDGTRQMPEVGIVIPAGYDVGSGACEVTKTGDKFAAKEIWRIHGNKDLVTQWSTPVFKDGYLYGMFSAKKFASGPIKCVELKTGQVKWEKEGFGVGNMILAGNRLIALADDGQVVVIQPDPTAYKEVSRFKGVAGKCWSTPALSKGRLFVRSTKEGAGFDLN